MILSFSSGGDEGSRTSQTRKLLLFDGLKKLRIMWFLWFLVSAHFVLQQPHTTKSGLQSGLFLRTQNLVKRCFDQLCGALLLAIDGVPINAASVHCFAVSDGLLEQGIRHVRVDGDEGMP